MLNSIKIKNMKNTKMKPTPAKRVEAKVTTIESKKPKEITALKTSTTFSTSTGRPSKTTYSPTETKSMKNSKPATKYGHVAYLGKKENVVRELLPTPSKPKIMAKIQSKLKKK